MSSTAWSATSWMKLIFWYSPEAMREIAAGDFGIDDGLAAAAAVIDHDDEILHAGQSTYGISWRAGSIISENQKLGKKKFG